MCLRRQVLVPRGCSFAKLLERLRKSTFLIQCVPDVIVKLRGIGRLRLCLLISVQSFIVLALIKQQIPFFVFLRYRIIEYTVSLST